MSHQNIHHEQVRVSLDKRSYNIYFAHLLQHTNTNWQMQDRSKTHRLQWITNTTLAQLYSGWLNRQSAEAPIVIPDGEVYKNWETLESIISKLLDNQLDRKSVLIAFGGGVIGDIIGFAAAIYQRGIPVIQIPTTLLSMVDSSVGGKTAINHERGKNMIGVIHQPAAVWIDPAFLRTLAQREYQAGLAEVVKYALLGDRDFLRDLQNQVPSIIQRDEAVLQAIIKHCCTMKAHIVMRDETEQGERALLNLGHTFGHAIESVTHYDTFLHGEAVALGMLMACALSQRMGYLSLDDETLVRDLLKDLGLPVIWQHPFTNRRALHENMLAAMAHDKKTQMGQLRLIILKRLGQAEIRSDIAHDMILDAIDTVAVGQ